LNTGAALYDYRLDARLRRARWFAALCAALTAIGVVILGVLVARVLWDGWPHLTISFLNRFPSRLNPESGGIKGAFYGTLWLIALTSLFVVPVGVGAAVYLHEYARRNRLTRFIEVNIANLAGVPSIVYGLLGLAIFVRWFTLGRSIWSGALTLGLVVLPVVIVASREALAAVPNSLRLAAYAVGASRWQTIRSHVLPAALPGIMTGVILAISRAIGEAAPLIVVGAVAFVRSVPSGPSDVFTALPIQIYNWCEEPDPVFHRMAAAAIVVLLAILVPLNALAVGVRAWHQKGKTW
jgi:phosphate transport system permease protein